jgi:16S rRNA U516 pseudouridylate synthase RsuA-like enzyme
MRITESQLRKIINTELRKVLAENVSGVSYTEKGIFLDGEELSIAKIISILKEKDSNTTTTKLSDMLDYSNVQSFEELKRLAEGIGYDVAELARTVALSMNVPFLKEPNPAPSTQYQRPSGPPANYDYSAEARARLAAANAKK